jgi:hypothetical protein
MIVNDLRIDGAKVRSRGTDMRNGSQRLKPMRARMICDGNSHARNAMSWIVVPLL